MIDFKLCNKNYNQTIKKLNAPSNLFHCTKEHYIDGGKYIIDNSIRKTGKTTSWLIYGIIAYVNCNSPFVYIRQGKTMVTPKASQTLFETVVDFGYIKHITNERYNAVTYKTRRWHLCLKDDNGEIIDIDPNPFCYVFSVEEAYETKSNVNLPHSYLIIYDEFINKGYMYNEFLSYMNLLSTIIRDKTKVLIVMLGNDNDVYSPYYRELEIYNDIKNMNVGDKKVIRTKLGTIIDFYFVETEEHKQGKVSDVVRTFFGFSDSKMSSITGLSDTWAFDICQHIPANVSRETMVNNVAVFSYGEFYKLEVVDVEEIGVCVYVYPITKIYDDTIIYTNENYDALIEYNNRGGQIMNLNNVIYNVGVDKFSSFLWGKFYQNMFFYSDNSTASFIKSYVENKI